MSGSLCLIMLGGEAPGSKSAVALTALLAESPYIVAADKGAEHLMQLGIMPHLLVGDGDSLALAAREACEKADVEVLVLPPKKDFTDGEAAFLAALKAGFRRLAVFGAFGGRVDHLLGNLLLPLTQRDNWESCTFYGEGFRAAYCFGETELQGRPGDTVSLVALSPKVTDLTLEGFSYPLLAYETQLGSSRCLSNELAAAKARVTFAEGIMLIIHYSD